MKPMFSSKEGFSLAEVVVTVLVLVLALVGIMRLFIYCTTLTEMSRNITFVMEEAQSKMENIKNDSFANIPSYSGQTFNLVQPSNGTGAITVSQQGGAAAPGDLLQVDIVVNWQNKDNRNQSSQLSTMIAER